MQGRSSTTALAATAPPPPMAVEATIGGSKRDRQRAIRELIATASIGSQGELVDRLNARGFAVTQATVSRDIAELGLVKVRAPSGRLVYAPPGGSDADRLRALGSAMRRYAVTVEAAGQLVIVTTPSGYANALAQAMDEASHPSVAGTLAGDNTIFVAARDGVAAQALEDELAGYLLQGAA